MNMYSFAITLLVFVAPLQRAEPVRVEGRVSDFRGIALHDVLISVESTDDEKLIAKASTGADGTYSVRVPFRGAVRLRASLTGFVSVEKKIIVGRGVTLWDVGMAVGLLADPLWTLIEGTVEDSKGRPVSDATVTLSTLYGHMQLSQVRSNARGQFNIRVAEQAPYVLTVASPNGTGDARLLNIREDKTAVRVTVR
jgi:hypothetical protein